MEDKTLKELGIDIVNKWSERLEEIQNSEDEDYCESLDFEDECIPIVKKILRQELIKEYHRSEGNKHKFIRRFLRLTEDDLNEGSDNQQKGIRTNMDTKTKLNPKWYILGEPMWIEEEDKN